MSFSKRLKNVGSHEMDEIRNFCTSRCVLIIKGVKNNTAVDVYVSTERVALECISSIYNWRVDVLFLLFCLFLEECLIVFEVFQ
jgi:hypothetical protein